MKFLILILVAFAYPTLAGIIEVREIQKNPHTFETRKIKVKSDYISSEERDKILKAEVPELIRNWDEVDRDLFYKSILHYENARIQEKYPQLTVKQIEGLREKFKR